MSMAKQKSVSKEKTGMQSFQIPPERFISAPVEAILQDLQDTLASQQNCSGKASTETFRKVARLIESTSQIDFLDARRRIRESFLTFASAAAGKAVPDAHGEEPSPEDLDEQEMTFLEDMYQLMQAAHFRLLSAEDWNTAQAEQFTFNSPVEVNWEYMDSSLMQRFWKNHEEERADVASISDRILVFHRGISTVRAQGTYINDKIDLLIEYLLVDPFQHLFRRIFKHDAKLHIALDLGDASGDGGYTFGEGPAAAAGVRKSNNSNSADEPTKEVEMQGLDSAGKAEEDETLLHSASQTVQRRSLRSIMPDAGKVFENFFKTLDIQEPAFKNMVVLYRRKVPDNPQRKSEYEPIRKHNVALERRNINIKRFDEIPMADAEMVFPDKKIFLKPLLIIQLLIAIIGGIVATFAALLSGKLSPQILLGTLSVVGTRAMQVYTSAQFARARVVDTITMQLYEQTMDAQEGVVYFLLEEMAQQRIKENLLAYALLLIRGVPLTQRQLDDACEAHLQQRFGEKLDFAIENSLPFLVHDGLIKETEDGAFEAVPLETAYDKLAAKWQGYFERSRDETDEADEADEATPLPAQGKRRSLFRKIRKASRSQVGQGTADSVSTAPPTTTPTVDKRSGIITLGDPTQPGATDTSGADQSSASRRSRFKEGLSNLVGKSGGNNRFA